MPTALSLCLRVVAVAALLAAAELRAAPPQLRHLFPSGVECGKTVAVSVGRTLDPHTTAAWSSRNDVRVRVIGGVRPLEVTAAPGAVPGVCWIRLYNSEGASAVRPFLIGSAPEIIEAEPNDRRGQAQSIVNPTVVVNGALSQTEDVDMFAVKLKAGQTLVASLLANRLLGSPMDCVLQILSDEGFVLAQNDDEPDLDPRIAFVAPTDGRFLVRVFAFPAEPGQAIRFYNSSEAIYRLTLSTGPFAEHPWPLAVTAGNQRRVELRGWNLGANAIRLVDAAHGAKEVSLDGAVSAVATSVRVVEHATFCEPTTGAVTHAARRLEIPVSISGVISKPTEIDEYVFPVTAGQIVEIEIESRALGFPLDPVIELVEPGGAVVEVDDTAGHPDASLSHRVQKSGELRVRVRDRFANGGPRYVYLLTVRIAEPQVQLSVSSDAFTMPRSKPLAIDVAIARSGGFSDPLTVTAVDLPAGLRATSAISAGEGPTSKSVQILLEEAGPIASSGPFRIVALRAGDLPAAWSATAELTKHRSTLTQLWLTVPVKPPRTPAHAKRSDTIANDGKKKL